MNGPDMPPALPSSAALRNHTTPSFGFRSIPSSANVDALPRRTIALLQPCSADLRYHFTASSAFRFSPPRPNSYSPPRYSCPSGEPRSAATLASAIGSVSLPGSTSQPSRSPGASVLLADPA